MCYLDGKRGFSGTAAIGKIKRGRGAKPWDEKPASAAATATAGSQAQNRWFTLLLHYSILLFSSRLGGLNKIKYKFFCR